MPQPTPTDPDAAIVVAPAAEAVVAQPDGDATLVKLWLHDRSAQTVDAYRRDAVRFLQVVDRPLAQCTLADLQRFADSLADRAPSSQKRTLSAVKSLWTFAHRLGYVQFNVGAALKLPKPKNTIAERILDEAAVQRLIDEEPDGQKRTLLLILYATGGCVFEVCGLRWRDCQGQRKGGQLTLYGKGGKTRHVLLKAETYLQLVELKGQAGADDPVFRLATGRPLSRQTAWRIVRAAADCAGIAADVSPHWLRHAHASHALDNGAPAHLVKETIGHASLDTTSYYAHARPTDSSARYLPV